MQISSHNAFKAIFPRYSEVLAQTTIDSNKDFQSFVREDLPNKVQLVRNIENTFIAFQNQYASLILKRPSYSNLMHSLLLKVTDKTQYYFNALGLKFEKSDQSYLANQFQQINFPAIRITFREKLQQLEELLREKYFNNSNINRQCEQQATRRMYNLFQIYHFTKSDLITASGKFQISQYEIMNAINSADGGHKQCEIGFELIKLSPEFKQYLYGIVQKRCRPFINKKDFLLTKMKQILKDSESRVGLNFHMLLDSIVRKEKSRVNKEFYNDLMKQVKVINLEGSNSDPTLGEAKQITKEVQDLKRTFGMLKNNTFYFQIMRGSFVDKYKIEVNKLQNLYYLANLQKYLQTVNEFMERLLRVQEKLIDSSKVYMKSFVSKIQGIITQLTYKYESRYINSITLQKLIEDEFKGLEDSLYGIFPQEEQLSYQSSNLKSQSTQDQKKFKAQQRRNQLQKQKQQRQQLRKIEIEKRAEEDLKKRQQQKLKMEQRRRLEQEKIKKYKQERQEKQKQRKLQDSKLQQQKKNELLKKQQEKRVRDEKQRQQRQQINNQKLQQKKKKEQEERRKIQEMRKGKELEDQKKKEQQRLKREQQEQKKHKLLEEKRKIDDQRRQEERKKKQQQNKQEEKKKKIEQQKKEKEKLQAERQEELRKEKEKNQQLEKQRKQRQRQEKQQNQRIEQQNAKQKQQERQLREKAQNQEKSKRLKEKEQEQRIQKQKAKLQKERKQKEKTQNQQQQRLRKLKEKAQNQQKQRRAREKAELQKKQQDQALRKQKQAKQKAEKEEGQRRQRQKKQRQQKERSQRQKKQREQREKLEKQKKQRETLERQKEEKESKQRENIRLQQEKERQLSKIAQEKLKEQQKKNAASSSVKNKKAGKSSGIDYNNFDDIIDDDFNQIQNSQDKPAQIAKGGKKPVKNQYQDDDDYGYDDDFNQQQQQKEETQQVETKELITEESLKCLNDYVKGTQYARKNKPNLQPFNNENQYIYIFEEMTQSDKLFIFKSEVSKAMTDLGNQLANEDATEEDLKITVDTIKEEIFTAYANDRQREDIDPKTRLVFPLPFENPLQLKIVEVLPHFNMINLVLKQALVDQAQLVNLNNFVQGFLHVFDMEGQPQVTQMLLSNETVMILDTFDKEIPCLLILYAMHYERAYTGKISIDQYTIERFFYCSNVLKPFYQSLQSESDMDAMIEFYNKLTEKFAEDNKVRISPVQIQGTNPDFQAILKMNAHKIKQDFLKTKQIEKSHLAMFQVLMASEQIQDQVEKYTIYVELSRGQSKPMLNYYIISKNQDDQEYCSQIFEIISDDIDDQFQCSIFTDFCRHNGLHEYSEWTLPLWAHLVTKRKMTPNNAFKAITLAMTPYYVSFKGMD